MENKHDFHYKRKLAHATAKSTLFAVTKDAWDIKKGTDGKSMKNIFYILPYVLQPNGTFQDDVTLKSEKIKPVI